MKTTFRVIIEFFNGTKKNYANCLQFFHGQYHFLYGQYCEIFSTGRVSVFVELKIDFLYKVAIGSSNFCFCSCIRVVFQWHFFDFFDGLYVQ